MIEAISTAVQTAPLIRGNANQVSTSESIAANPERVQQVVQAPFISPAIGFNTDYNKAVLQIRNGDTGEVIETIPADSRLEAQRRAQVTEQERIETALVGEDAQFAVGPQTQEDSAQADAQIQQKQLNEAAAVSVQQIAAFESAARSGNTNAGTVSLFA